MPVRLHGFSLRSRNWGIVQFLTMARISMLTNVSVSLDIDSIQDIEHDGVLEGQKAGFEDLVIPDG